LDSDRGRREEELRGEAVERPASGPRVDAAGYAVNDPLGEPRVRRAGASHGGWTWKRRPILKRTSGVAPGGPWTRRSRNSQAEVGSTAAR
jgi:hypothetical protein